MTLAQHDDHDTRHSTLVTDVHLRFELINLKLTLAAKRHHKATHISFVQVLFAVAVNNVKSVARFAIDHIVSLNGELLSLAELLKFDLEGPNLVLHLVHIDVALHLVNGSKAARFAIVGLLNMEAHCLCWLNVNEVALEMTAACHSWLVNDHDCNRVFVICLTEIGQKLLQNKVLQQRHQQEPIRSRYIDIEFHHFFDAVAVGGDIFLGFELVVDTKCIERTFIKNDFEGSLFEVHLKHIANLIVDLAAWSLLHLLDNTRFEIERNHVMAHDANMLGK